MKKFLYAALTALIISSCFFGCKEDIVEEKEEKGQIAGSVTDEKTKDPIGNAKVTLTPGGNSKLTGTDGKFYFSDLQSGSYTIKVCKEGYDSISSKFDVMAGLTTNADLSIKRRPTKIIPNKDVLDFGEEASKYFLSFSIINDNYEDMNWQVDYDCKWIKEINPVKGTLKHNDTETIKVTIDRDLLDAGHNETYLVLSSKMGSTEIKVIAIGEEHKKPEVSLVEITDIKPTSVLLHGKIIDPGLPEYTERGFICSTEPKPVINSTNKFSIPKNKEPDYYYRLENLHLEQGYYARAYATNRRDTVYSKDILFYTDFVQPEVSIQKTNIDLVKKTAIFNGTIVSSGDPAYSEKGFVYSAFNNPTIYDSTIVAKGSGTGVYSAKTEHLPINTILYVRAYAKNAGGIVYSPTNDTVSTIATQPQVSIEKATKIDIENGNAVLYGTIVYSGNPPYSEKGFVWSTMKDPKIEEDNKIAVNGTGEGTFSIKVSSLPFNETIYVRAYAINEAGTAYSPKCEIISTVPVKPELSVQDATEVDVVNGSAILHGTIISAGDPAYTERGFVYDIYDNPTIEKNKIVADGTGTGAYYAQVSDLPLDDTLFVSAYATYETDTTYSNESIIISTMAILPKVVTSDPADVDIPNGSATLLGRIDDEGKPAYTERGFVWSTLPDPSINDNKIVANGTGTGNYSLYTTELPKSKIYYIRAYATNRGGTAYGNEVSVSEEWINLPAAGISVQKTDIGQGQWDDVNNMCQNSILGGYTDWRLPTKDELTVLYNNKNEIGGFKMEAYWSSSGDYSLYYYIDFSDGYSDYTVYDFKHDGRCVRTIATGQSQSK